AMLDVGVSPVGSILRFGTANGSLATKDGVWTFHPTTDPSGNFVILLNGQPTSLSAAGLEIGPQGQLLAVSWGNYWSQWANGGWSRVASPNDAITVNAARLKVGQNSAAVPIGIAAPTDSNYVASQLAV